MKMLPRSVAAASVAAAVVLASPSGAAYDPVASTTGSVFTIPTVVDALAAAHQFLRGRCAALRSLAATLMPRGIRPPLSPSRFPTACYS